MKSFNLVGMRISLLLLLVLGIGLYAEGQSFYALRRERSVTAIGGVGTSTYFGELSNPGDYIDARPTISLGLKIPVFQQLSIRGEAAWFQLSGTDEKADSKGRVRRNLSFVSSNFEGGLTAVLDFLPRGTRFYQRPAVNLYGFIGISALYFDPKAEYQGQKYSLQPLQTEMVKYSRIVPVVPYGLGIAFKSGPFFNVLIEGGYRKTFTDYLDDVSTVHPGASAFSDPIAAALSDRGPEIGVAPANPGAQRGNPDKKDSYFLMSIKIEYYLPYNFLSANRGNKLKTKRKAFYRYNKRGGLKRR